MQDASRDDALTLMALGILAFVLADITHEALGHGLVALAVGARPVLLTTCYLVTNGNFSRWIPAGGGLANMVIGLFCLLWLRRFRPRSAHFAYFLLLAAAFNLLFAAGYPFYSGLAAFGDWAAVISGLTPPWFWRVLLVVVSVVLYYLFLVLLAHAIRPFCDPEELRGRERLRRLTLIPYLAALVAAGFGGVFNPSGWTLTFTHALPAAAAAFGFSQMDHFPQTTSADTQVTTAGQLTRSRRWIAAAALALIFFGLVLGRGLRFSTTP